MQGRDGATEAGAWRYVYLTTHWSMSQSALHVGLRGEAGPEVSVEVKGQQLPDITAEEQMKV